MSASAVPPSSPTIAQRRPAGGASREASGAYRLSPVALVVGLTLLGAILRFATLDLQSIWSDEAATILLVRRGLGGLLSHLSTSETTPPLYFVAAWGWTKVFGASVYAYRSLSALAGTATIPVIYVAGRRISPRVGVWAAAFTTIDPAMYYYSQEARSYALLIFFSAVALVFWQRALERPGAGPLAGWAVMSSLAVLTHYFGAFLFVAQAAMLVRRLGWRRVLPWAAIVAAVGAALVPLAREQSDHVLNGSHTGSSWIEGVPLLSRFAQVPKQYLVGLYSPQEIVTTVLVGLLALAAIWRLARRGERREQGQALELAAMAAIALLIPAFLSITHIEDVFNGRNVMASWVPWVLVLAAAVGFTRSGRTGALLGTAILAISVAIVASVDLIPGYQRDDWHGIASALRAPAARRVVVAPELGAAPLFIYMHTDQDLRGTSVATRELAFVAIRTQRTGRAPLPPVVPTDPPPGFRLVGVRRGEAFAVSRFRALGDARVTVSMRSLRREDREPAAEIFLQR
ncbi:MAG TPA: glycosyltransferase family 39 protein [Solirubrobacteraceae bacterium]|nr:glycosyltransferase family 39 protein [Solirubrobacteraceae bacterium]